MVDGRVVEGELLSADDFIEAMALWCREKGDHPPLAILLGVTQLCCPEVLQGAEGMGPELFQLHLFVQYCIHGFWCASAEALIREVRSFVASRYTIHHSQCHRAAVRPRLCWDGALVLAQRLSAVLVCELTRAHEAMDGVQRFLYIRWT